MPIQEFSSGGRIRKEYRVNRKEYRVNRTELKVNRKELRVNRKEMRVNRYELRINRKHTALEYNLGGMLRGALLLCLGSGH